MNPHCCYTWLSMGKYQVVERFDAFKESTKESTPVVLGDYDATIFSAHELGMADLSTTLISTLPLSYEIFASLIQSTSQGQTLCAPPDFIESCKNPPCQILHKIAIFILTSTCKCRFASPRWWWERKWWSKLMLPWPPHQWGNWSVWWWWLYLVEQPTCPRSKP